MTFLEFLDGVTDSTGKTCRLAFLVVVAGSIATTALILALDSQVWTVVSGSPALAVLVSVGSNVLAYLTYTAIKKRRESRAARIPAPRSEPPLGGGQGGDPADRDRDTGGGQEPDRDPPRIGGP